VKINIAYKNLAIRLLTPFTFLYYTVSAQEVNITHVELQGSDVIIHYILQDEDLNRRYSLHLYNSIDNYIQPMEMVSGDIGVDIAVGENKKVVWHAMEELGEDFDGEVALELKGSIYIPFISMDGFEDYKLFKRGKPYDLIWSGGRGDNILNFELYQGDTKVKVFEERPNVGNTLLVIPTDVKPGKNYRFKISDTRNRDEVVFTSTFIIKRKIPLALKLGLGFAVGGIVGYLIGSSDSSEPDIPEPPLPQR